MQLLRQQRGSLSQRKRCISMLELLAKLMNRTVVLFGLGKVSNQSHRAEKPAKGVIESSSIDFRRECQRYVVLRELPLQGQFKAAGASRSGAAFVETVPSHRLLAEWNERGIGQSDEFVAGEASKCGDAGTDRHKAAAGIQFVDDVVE